MSPEISTSPPAARTAVVTGASSGIGQATARRLAEAGYQVTLGARRIEPLRELANEIGGRAVFLDVTDPETVEAFVANCPDVVDLLVNNAGISLGMDPVEHSADSDWQAMWDTNVLGVVRVTRSLLGAMRKSGNARLVVVGSTSGFETYRGGAGYTSSKHALRAVVKTLRLELLGEPICVTEICPGLAETGFSIHRFGGDRDRAAAVYKGMTPLAAEDVAEAILFAASRPPHVNVDEIVIRPLAQATATDVVRGRD